MHVFELTVNLRVKLVRGQRYVCKDLNTQSNWYLAFYQARPIWTLQLFGQQRALLVKQCMVCPNKGFEGAVWTGYLHSIGISTVGDI